MHRVAAVQILLPVPARLLTSGKPGKPTVPTTVAAETRPLHLRLQMRVWGNTNKQTQHVMFFPKSLYSQEVLSGDRVGEENYLLQLQLSGCIAGSFVQLYKRPVPHPPDREGQLRPYYVNPFYSGSPALVKI